MTPEGLLFERQLIEPRFKRIGESEDHAEHVVGIAWRKTVKPPEAKRFKGAFARDMVESW
jgi:hypothetical protein